MLGPMAGNLRHSTKRGKISWLDDELLTSQK
jgi:hypothetical protein